MTSNEIYRSEPRENTPKEGIPLVNIYVDQKEIPLKKDWSKRECTMTQTFPRFLHKTLNFKCRDDDVWVVTMPKCGTTWMQEAAWLVYNDFNFEVARKVPIIHRSIFTEFKGLEDEPYDSYAAADALESPRLLKSHLPASLLPKEIWKKKNKVIYVARNVKDAVISFHHFANALSTFKGTKEQFLQAFMKDDLYYCPFWPHILEFYEMRNEKNIFFTSFERMKTDLRKVIIDLCLFLKKPIPNEDIMDQALNHLDFNTMKDSPSGKAMQAVMDKYKKDNNNTDNTFQFMRRGQIGSYKDELTKEEIKMLDDWSSSFLMEAGVSEEELFFN